MPKTPALSARVINDAEGVVDGRCVAQVEWIRSGTSEDEVVLEGGPGYPAPAFRDGDLLGLAVVGQCYVDCVVVEGEKGVSGEIVGPGDAIVRGVLLEVGFAECAYDTGVTCWLR